MKQKLLYIFPLIVVVIVGIISLTHKPFDSFDETNVIRIVAQPVETITEILRFEPNFPLYYFLLKAFRTVTFNSAFLLQLGYYVSYVASGILFLKIVLRFSGDKKVVPILLGLYYAIPAVIYNASYIRMYNPAITLGFLTLLFLLKFHESKRTNDLFIALISLVLVVILHPIGIFVTIMFFPIWFMKELSNKQRIVIISAFMVTVLGVLLQFATKLNTSEAVGTSDLNYINALNVSFATVGLFFNFSSTVLKPRNADYLLLFPFFVLVIADTVLVLFNIIKKKVFSFPDSLAFVSFVIFFIAPLVLNGKIFIHHLHYLLPFGIFSVVYSLLVYGNQLRFEIGSKKRLIAALFVIAISVLLTVISGTRVVSINAVNQNSSIILMLVGILITITAVLWPKINNALLVVATILMLSFTLVFYYYIPVIVNAKKCDYFRNEVATHDRYFFVQHNEANFYINCLGSNQNIVLIDENRKLLYLNDHTEFDILTEQSKRGGSLGTFDEMQKVFTDDVSLVQYSSIKNISVWLLNTAVCTNDENARRLTIEGFSFVSCGKEKEYLYTRSQ